MVVEKKNVFALECGVWTSRGVVALEENVVVTEQGGTYLSSPQHRIISVHQAS